MAIQRRNASNKKKNAAFKEHENNESENHNSLPEHAEPKTINIQWGRIIRRFVLSLLLVFAVYWTSDRGHVPVFAAQKDKIKIISADVDCSKSYLKDISTFKGCSPDQCGRLVTDIAITPEEAAHLLHVSRKGLAFGGSNGGASILDLHSGALSYGDSFINIYEKLKQQNQKDIFADVDFKIYSNVRRKIQQIISYNFGVKMDKLHLTHPTFFSEMTSRKPVTKHDEYWHVHIDKETYPSFHYTSLLYLTDYKTDFTGGRFIFVGQDKNATIEPRVGRVSAFTSGAENPHYVEKVESGTRYALTVSFTCDPKLAIQDPSMDKFL